MGTNRVALLASVLVVLVIVLLTQSQQVQMALGIDAWFKEAPLAGNNTISGLEVHRDANGRWIASYDYFYTGAPLNVFVRVTPTLKGGPTKDAERQMHSSGIAQAERGQHHVSLEVRRPFMVTDGPLTATHLTAQMLNVEEVIATQRIDQEMSWPDMQTWAFEENFRGQTPAANFQRAVTLIDEGGGSNLAWARRILERLIQDDPKFAAGYVQLARIALNTNLGSDGFRQAEGLLNSALAIDRDDSNAKILLGFIYAHQGRFAQSEKIYSDLAPSNPANVWFWTDWGEMLALQGKWGGALEKYRTAIGQPHPERRDDRAQEKAYGALIARLSENRQWEGVEELFERRSKEFSSNGCYRSEFALFELQQRGDAAKAVGLARDAIGTNCSTSDAREVIGAANYLLWSQSTEDKRVGFLNEARVYLPMGPRALYFLASSSQTVAAAKGLIKGGEDVDQMDTQRQSALAYALNDGDLDAAKRLLELGAAPSRTVGSEGMPVAFLPIMTDNAAGVRLLKQHGADYEKLRFQGLKARDFARQLGRVKVLKVIDGASSTT
jgi:tetratricopeptide (TPR) repeat protein